MKYIKYKIKEQECKNHYYKHDSLSYLCKCYYCGKLAPFSNYQPKGTK